MAPIVAQIRSRWPGVKFLLRADSGFARDELMAWCKASRLIMCSVWLATTAWSAPSPQTWLLLRPELGNGDRARRFADFAWSTRASWSRERWAIAKAEHLPKSRTESGSNSSTYSPTAPQRPPCAPISSGSGFLSFTYVLLKALRRIGLRHTQFAAATCGMTGSNP
jgi:Transposase DDE domain group 1